MSIHVDPRLILTNDGVFLTVQGEGLYTGQPSVFIRLSGCNLRCQWEGPRGTVVTCDTPYSSFRPERNVLTVDSVLERVRALLQEHHAPIEGMHAVVTGGEPTIQEAFPLLVESLIEAGMLVTVETNGMRAALNLHASTFLSVSPKLKGSGNPHFKDYARTVANAIGQRRAQLKYVISNVHDAHEALGFTASVREAMADKLWAETIEEMWMPMGDDAASVQECAEWLIPLCITHNVRYCDRMHVRQWGKKRGV